jgi:cytochrome c oxidase subunit 2
VNVDFFEKIWMVVAAVLIAAFLAAITVAAGAHAVHPPSHVETIDPQKVRDTEEFALPSVKTTDDGRVVVSVVVEMFAFDPDPIEIPAGKPVTFRLTSPDVIHGFQVVGTNANTMVVPGYVSEFTITFDTPGEYLVLCNEFCGLLHHEMMGRLIALEPGS